MGDKGSGSFFQILKTYKVLFKKSQLPAVKTAKDSALCSLRDEYMRKFGQKITTAQLRKKIQNMKNDVKKKSNIRATGNKPIILKEWEREMLELLEKDSNPVFNKIPGAINVSFGIEIEKPSDLDLTCDGEADTPEKCNFNRGIEKKNAILKTKKGILADETEETKNLTLPELQRLVLLRQLKLINMKIRDRERKQEEHTVKAENNSDNESNQEYSVEIFDDIYSTDI